jgi:PPOX class probable FMN-dependent enzyme
MNRAQQKFGEPSKFIKTKVKPHMDPVVQEFIRSAPFAVIASCNANGDCDASPKGGDPGFIKVLDEKSLLIPDFSGNKLFQSYENIEANPKVGLIFLIPGCGLTVRVNGRVRVVVKEELRSNEGFAAQFDLGEEKDTQQALFLDVEEAYPHCPRAFAFSGLWDTGIIEQNRTARSDQFWFDKWSKVKATA